MPTSSSPVVTGNLRRSVAAVACRTLGKVSRNFAPDLQVVLRGKKWRSCLAAGKTVKGD